MQFGVQNSQHSLLQSDLSSNSVVLHDASTQRWLYFHHPVQVLVATSVTEVLRVLETVQHQVNQGYYAAGFVSYEAAPAFDASLKVLDGHDFPLAWFGLYEQPETLMLPEVGKENMPELQWHPDITQQQYQDAIHQIKNYIAQGLTYQVNFSFRLEAAFSGDPWIYFQQLIQAQNGSYGAFVNLSDWAICCASPELFFQLNDRTLLSRPMKGTAPRGLTYASDRHFAQALLHSAKNQAENVMIVDMIRNDMGRIAHTGSVQVTRLFDIEQYPTLWQMTSPVQCNTDAALPQLLQALFPCASITGAPKPRTMQIIAELEASSRRIYTGTIGYLSPERTAQFNVAIRTVLINKMRQEAEYGVGGGIVWDSTAVQEYDECCTKAKILTQRQPQFDLLESLLWTPDQGYTLLDLHLQRLQESAAYFAFAFDKNAVLDKLMAIAYSLPNKPHKVRLLLSKQGHLQLEASELMPSKSPLRVGLAKFPIDSSTVFLYHKTTHRRVYEQAKAASPEYDDVLLWNEQGELTESCIANLVLEFDGQWYTPPVECGLLAGTFRAWLLQQGKVQEQVIHLENLHQYSRVLLINSVRQIQEAIVNLPTSLPSLH